MTRQYSLETFVNDTLTQNLVPRLADSTHVEFYNPADKTVIHPSDLPFCAVYERKAVVTIHHPILYYAEIRELLKSVFNVDGYYALIGHHHCQDNAYPALIRYWKFHITWIKNKV